MSVVTIITLISLYPFAQAQLTEYQCNHGQQQIMGRFNGNYLINTPTVGGVVVSLRSGQEDIGGLISANEFKLQTIDGEPLVSDQDSLDEWRVEGGIKYSRILNAGQYRIVIDVSDGDTDNGDIDNDGIPDEFDDDVDNDGIPDSVDEDLPGDYTLTFECFGVSTVAPTALPTPEPTPEPTNRPSSCGFRLNECYSTDELFIRYNRCEGIESRDLFEYACLQDLDITCNDGSKLQDGFTEFVRGCTRLYNQEDSPRCCGVAVWE